MTAAQILQILQQEEQYQREVDRAQGAREQLEKQLREQFAVDPAGAREMLGTFTQEIKQDEERLEKLLREYEHETEGC